MNEIINGAEKIDEMAGELLYYVSDEAVNLEKMSVKKDGRYGTKRNECLYFVRKYRGNDCYFRRDIDFI